MFFCAKGRYRAPKNFEILWVISSAVVRNAFLSKNLDIAVFFGILAVGIAIKKGNKMSEWGIEQHSTFGNAGGCFVDGISVVGVIAIIAGLASIDSTQDKTRVKDKAQPKVESVRQNVVAVPSDTVIFVPEKDAVFRDIEKQNEFLLQKTARDLKEIDRLSRMHSHTR